MIITLTYQPDKGVSFDETILLSGTDRRQIRTLLNDKFKIGDNVVDLSKYNNGDTSQNIVQRRDIYKNYKGQNNFFFLNFDTNERLKEVELHYGLRIKIKDVNILFSMNIEKVAQLLDIVSNEKKQLSEGEYFYKNLKLTIASSKAVGGDGNKLSYFYCSKDVTHLMEE